jgi:hypothetical protein
MNHISDFSSKVDFIGDFGRYNFSYKFAKYWLTLNKFASNKPPSLQRQHTSCSTQKYCSLQINGFLNPIDFMTNVYFRFSNHSFHCSCYLAFPNLQPITISWNCYVDCFDQWHSVCVCVCVCVTNNYKNKHAYNLVLMCSCLTLIYWKTILFQVFAFLGFLMSIVWIYMLANEVINVLEVAIFQNIQKNFAWTWLLYGYRRVAIFYKSQEQCWG